MEIKSHLLLLLCTISMTAYTQHSEDSSLNIGDSTPSLHVREWIKGSPILQMEEGRIYVIEFWATWCIPCIAAMPHLSDLASQYKDKVTIIGVNVYEKENTSVKQIREFVDNMGDRMNYHVAIDDDNRMVDEWIDAAEEKGIPKSFVVNAEGRLAWIGHPKDLDTVLRKMVANNWDINETLEKRNEQRRLDSLEREVSYLLRQTKYNFNTQTNERVYNTPESLLKAIEKIVKDEPKLRNTYMISSYTFSSLLQIDQRKAYDYGKSVLASPFSGRFSPYYGMIEVIRSYSDTLNLIPEIYHLGAEAYQEEINRVAYPEIVNMHNYYSNMAKWYWEANNKSKAIASQEKAIEALKSKKEYAVSDLVVLETQLQQYKEMETVK